MDDLSFAGRVAIVTGAGGGLGREYACLLAARRAQVVVNDLGVTLDGQGGTDTTARAVVAEIEARGGTAVADTNSVATAEGGAALVQTALDAFGRVDIVVNNAGILRDQMFHKLSADLLDPVLDVHLRGAFHVTGPAWRVMREQGYGRVVNTCSTSGLFGNLGQANYAAAKTGLIGLTRVLALEGARYGIKANIIVPGAATRMTPAGVVDDPDRLRPELVAPVVAWLVHEQCPVSGEMFRAAGGRVSRCFIAMTEGYENPALSPEDVRDAFAQIMDTTDFAIPGQAVPVPVADSVVAETVLR
jgi:NAD(P)-dependent dehydrogenase (short-subunit alcohol dehydrogenase family)